eukprot:1134371-Pelagomonas_calceolata.AAC.3
MMLPLVLLLTWLSWPGPPYKSQITAIQKSDHCHTRLQWNCLQPGSLAAWLAGMCHANKKHPQLWTKDDRSSCRGRPLWGIVLGHVSQKIWYTTRRAIKNSNASQSQVLEPGASNNPPDPP